MNIAKRKEQLRQEIEVAEANLIHNLSTKNITEYIMPDIGSLKNVGTLMASNPMMLIDTLDSFSRSFLKPDNIIRKIFKYLGIAKTFTQQFMPKEND